MSSGLEHVVTEGEVSHCTAVSRCRGTSGGPKVVMSWASPSLTADSQWQQRYVAVQHHAKHLHCCFPEGRKGWERSSSGRAFFRLGEASACLRSFHCEASCSLILWEEGRKELLGRTCSAGCPLSPESVLRCGWIIKSFRTTWCKWSLGPRGWWVGAVVQWKEGMKAVDYKC